MRWRLAATQAVRNWLRIVSEVSTSSFSRGIRLIQMETSRELSVEIASKISFIRIVASSKFSIGIVERRFRSYKRQTEEDIKTKKFQFLL
jgi:hypothetical protein